jgi:hypothetical protein
MGCGGHAFSCRDPAQAACLEKLEKERKHTYVRTKSIEKRSLVGVISERFVPQPSNESRTIDVINGIGEFKTRCRWAEYWRTRNTERASTEQTVWAAYYHEHPELEDFCRPVCGKGHAPIPIGNGWTPAPN